MRTRIVIDVNGSYQWVDVVDIYPWSIGSSRVMPNIHIVSFDNNEHVAMRLGRDYFIVT